MVVNIPEDFETCYAKTLNLGLAHTVNNDFQSRANNNLNVGHSFSSIYQASSAGDLKYTEDKKFEQYQQYFENNVMRPIIYRPQKIAYTAGNLPVEYTYQVEITHEILVKKSDRTGIPNDI